VFQVHGVNEEGRAKLSKRTVQACDELEKVLKIAAFAQLRNLRSTDPGASHYGC
jgi:hypothetical protein